jgi:hypothetical protein
MLNQNTKTLWWYQKQKKNNPIYEDWEHIHGGEAACPRNFKMHNTSFKDYGMDSIQIETSQNTRTSTVGLKNVAKYNIKGKSDLVGGRFFYFNPFKEKWGSSTTKNTSGCMAKHCPLHRL